MLYAEARRLLIRKLGMKSYCTLELRRWLQEKGATQEIIEGLLAEFKSYLDDAQWLETFVSAQRARRYGRRTIALKLMQKGFSEEEIAQALSESEEGGDEEAAIRQLLQSRYRSRNLQDYRERQKVIASLMRRGFSLDLILKILR